MADVTRFWNIVDAEKIYIACTTSILIWDWLSCLPQERKHIWARDWSHMKFLYFMVRYYTLVVLVVTDAWFFSEWSEAACARYVRVLPGIAVLIDLSIESVLAVRIYAIYGRDKRMAAFLITMLTGFLGVMIAVPILAFDFTRLPSWPGPCMVTGKESIAGPKFIIAFYAAPMTCDIVMTILTVYRLIDQNRRGGGASSLMNRVVRDGLLYFFAITSLNLINVVFFIQSDQLIQAFNAPMSIQLSSVLCCRLILNLRAENDNNTIRKFSQSRGRFVTDVIHDASIVAHPIRFSANPSLLTRPVQVYPAHPDRRSGIGARGMSMSVDGSVTMTSMMEPGMSLSQFRDDEEMIGDTEMQSQVDGESWKEESSPVDEVPELHHV
ncbi:hypothetical protein HMN09_00160500 [Mycena chlorophos]|uniref:DUF6533 domain-containing protein n=1 Tax=Mycena chlorophos TaxID=658473 RepID=A0A8H6WKG9_MYCCL|nr:hypothetical protein HMN09_00160500 [Mycena chlorophos]